MVQSNATHDVWRQDDDWTGIQEKEQRKKRQNRLNQRAFRRRNAQKPGTSNPEYPFRVDRFRLVEAPDSRSKKAVRRRETQEENQTQKHTSTKSQLQKCLETLAQRNIFESSPGSGTNNFLVLDPRSTPIPVGYEPLMIHQQRLVLIPPLPTSSVNAPLVSHTIPEITRIKQTFDPKATLLAFENAGPDVYFPLSSDHLLHLIHHNVFRALITNKKMITSATQLSRTERCDPAVVPSFSDLCDGFTVIVPLPGHLLPQTLCPTYSQMTIGHSSWFNMFPHPRIRDNLIRQEGFFDPYDFCNDLFGELIAGRKYSAPELEGPVEDTVDDITHSRKGLIVWGEPWDVGGWEVTPGFVKKWSWALEGCEDLIAASNRWRAERDEEPLKL
jgi:hypothetical protein